MREIPLTQGKVALVDDADYEYCMRFRWMALRNRTTWYAVRKAPAVNGKRQHISLHRDLMSCPHGKQIDHKDWDGLNCQRGNLRICTLAQNLMHRRGRPATNPYRGISWSKSASCWKVAIKANGKYKHIGNFANPIEAARAYDKYAELLHGEFAVLNFPSKEPHE